jgi:hypothetical protein
LNGTPQQQRKVKDVMQEWTWYGNLTFVRLAHGDMSASVRIEFKRGHGSWSYIGKQALELKTGPTMQLDISDNDEMPAPYERYMILHEFGHALGLIHEHQVICVLPLDIPVLSIDRVLELQTLSAS